MPRIRLIQIGVWVTLAMTAGCGGGGGGSSPPPQQPPAEPEPTFDYSIEGKAVKGVIAGALVSVIDADGASVSGATATSGSDGSYNITFSTAAEIAEPVQI